MNWTEQEYSEYMAKFNGKKEDRHIAYGRTLKAKTNPPIQTSNLESAFIPTPKKAVAGKEANQRFRIHIHSKRRRLTDPDGLSAKACLDGLVLGGLLTDDSAKQIVSVTYSQEKAETDETVIEVWEIV